MPHSGTALINPSLVLNEIKLQKGMRVADLGCGRTGHFVFPAAKIVGDSGIVYAADIIKNILESIKSRSRSDGFMNIETVWSDIEQEGKVPIPARSLDACFMVSVLHQLKNKQAGINEAARLLQLNGKLVVIDWNKKLGLAGPTDEAMIKEDDLIKMAEKAGLKYKKNLKVGDFHYCLIFSNEV